MRALLLAALLSCGRSEPRPPDGSEQPDPIAALEAQAEVESEPGYVPEPSLPPWVEWPIEWGEERERLTVAYLTRHRTTFVTTGDATRDSTMVPKAIVLHWTAGPTAASAWHSFNPTKARGRNLSDHQQLNLSAHFVVERDGTVFRLLDETRVGRHAIGLNHLSVGIENVGDGVRKPLTEAQVDANERVIRWLAARYPITHLVGHFETRAMEAHPYFEEANPKHRSHRLDPGPEFMERVRDRVADLALQGPPSPALPGG